MENWGAQMRLLVATGDSLEALAALSLAQKVQGQSTHILVHLHSQCSTQHISGQALVNLPSVTSF